jgi:hypothetical protein
MNPDWGYARFQGKSYVQPKLALAPQIGAFRQQKIEKWKS